MPWWLARSRTLMVYGLLLDLIGIGVLLSGPETEAVP